ncbi:MAG: hypothetical protein ACK559_28560 [bacterium]
MRAAGSRSITAWRSRESFARRPRVGEVKSGSGRGRRGTLS